MSFLAKIFGELTTGTVVTAAEGVANIIDKFVETPEEKQAAELLKAKLMMRPSLAQAEINKIEAAHRSIFVAGWRPFIGWVCGVSLAYNFVLRDMIAWVIVNTGSAASMPPDIAMDQLITILLAMLGLGAFRTAEKVKGVAK